MLNNRLKKKNKSPLEHITIKGLLGPSGPSGPIIIIIICSKRLIIIIKSPEGPIIIRVFNFC